MKAINTSVMFSPFAFGKFREILHYLYCLGEFKVLYLIYFLF